MLPEEAPPRSLARRAGGVAVLGLAAYLLLKVVFHVVVGIISGVLWALVAIAAVVAVVWALRQL
jgi:hypothetical protein